MSDTAKQIDDAITHFANSRSLEYEARTANEQAATLALMGIALKTLDRIATALEAQNVRVDHRGQIVEPINRMPDPDRV